jgi:hypothetical protein
MLLRCDTSAADKYTSQAQRSRVLSGAWFQSNGYCLSCDNDRLLATTANTKARDFVCPSCNHNYELKALRTRPKRTLVDGAYSALMSRILDGSVPTLMMLERNDAWEIQSLTAIHHLFLTPSVVEERKPLSPTARRAGWVGCNIRLDLISPDAQVAIVGDGRLNEPKLVREAFQRYDQLRIIEPTKERMGNVDPAGHTWPRHEIVRSRRSLQKGGSICGSLSGKQKHPRQDSPATAGPPRSRGRSVSRVRNVH